MKLALPKHIVYNSLSQNREIFFYQIKINDDPLIKKGLFSKLLNNPFYSFYDECFEVQQELKND